MTGRFSHLEFNEDHCRPTPPPAENLGVEERSGGHYLAQADEAYRWGECEQALRLYTRALEEQRSLLGGWVGQVRMLVELGEMEEARMWSDKALELFRDNGELLAAKAQACLRAGNAKVALALSDAAMKSPGSSAWRWQVRGEIMLVLEEKTFDYCFQKALTEPNTDWFDRVLIARIFMHHRRIAGAYDMAKQAVELQPAAAYAWYILGHCLHELGTIQGARKSFQRCLELRPDFRPARSALRDAAPPSFMQKLKRFFDKRICL